MQFCGASLYLSLGVVKRCNYLYPFTRSQITLIFPFVRHSHPADLMFTGQKTLL